MARKRMIDPNIWNSEDFAQLSSFAKLVFIGLFSQADDEGRGRAKPIYLKSVLFPYDGTISADDVQNALEEIAEHMSIVFYSCGDGKEYYMLKNWRIFQTINKPTPSKLPLPEDYNSATAGLPPNRIEGNGREEEAEEKRARRNAPQKQQREYLSFYSENIGTVTPAVAAEAEAFLADEGMEDAVIVMALKEAVDAGAKNWRYAKSVLSAWLENGIRTAEAAKEHMAGYQQRKRKKPPDAGDDHRACGREEAERRRADAYADMERLARES